MTLCIERANSRRATLMIQGQVFNLFESIIYIYIFFFQV